MEASEVVSRLKDQECMGCIVSIRYLDDLREEYRKHREAGALDEAFYQESLTAFDFRPPEQLKEARSVILVAVPQPQLQFTFGWNGSRIPMVVPPTYLPVRKFEEQVAYRLNGILEAEGHRIEPAVLPKKLLAARSGMAKYGRNNITYIPGMGSFNRMTVFYSDVPCGAEPWHEPAVMEGCRKCHACIRHCPADAIDPERFMIRAERCISYHNEKPTNVPFPSWMDPAWHNCLVGCLLCQTVCPENKKFLSRVEAVAEFSAGETRLLMEGIPFDRLPGDLARKLEEWEMTEYLDVLPRNLKALLDGMAN